MDDNVFRTTPSSPFKPKRDELINPMSNEQLISCPFGEISLFSKSESSIRNGKSDTIDEISFPQNYLSSGTMDSYENPESIVAPKFSYGGEKYGSNSSISSKPNSRMSTRTTQQKKERIRANAGVSFGHKDTEKKVVADNRNNELIKTEQDLLYYGKKARPIEYE